MELYILNDNFERVGSIDNYECLVWKRNYYKPSEFSMQIIPNFEQFQLLKKGAILLKVDKSKEAMFIDHRELSENDEGVEVLVVSGYSLSKWIDRRITKYKQLEKGSVETVIRNYIDKNCISVEANRKLPNLVQSNNNNLGQQVEYLSHYKPLLDEIECLASTYELGYKIDLDLISKQYVFDVYEGLDRTYNQSINSRAIFSSNFENISNQVYIESDNNYKNYCLVAGVGEDADRKLYEIGNNNIGLDRFEMFVDARDISNTKDDETIIPDSDYNKLLEARGKEKLSECTEVKTFDCVINNTENLLYRVDFDLGDKVSIINQKWGLLLHERIVSITETYDIEGMKLDIEIGNNVPTLIDKIKRMR